MAVNQKNLRFNDFQRMLEENEGKPIYKKESDKYSLGWTIGGFTYHTEVLFKSIHSSYSIQYGKEDNKAAIEKFHDIYLKDAYEDIGLGFKEESVALFSGVPEVREQEEKPENKWKYTHVTELKHTIRKSTWMESDKDGGFIIKALNDKNAVVTVGEIKRVDGRLVSSVDNPLKPTTQVRREKIDIQKSDRDTEKFNSGKHKTKQGTNI